MGVTPAFFHKNGSSQLEQVGELEGGGLHVTTPPGQYRATDLLHSMAPAPTSAWVQHPLPILQAAYPTLAQWPGHIHDQH